MKINKFSLVCFMLLLIIIPVVLATLKDYLNTNDDSRETNNAGTARWWGQTWTATSTYTATGIRTKMSKYGDCGTVTLSLRATSSDLPTGADLASVSFACSSLSTVNSASTPWVNYTLSSGVSITSGTKYAIVARSTVAGGGTNYLSWRTDIGSAYSTGSAVYSDNSGATWADEGVEDFMFEVYADSGAAGYTHKVDGVTPVKVNGATPIKVNNI